MNDTATNHGTEDGTMANTPADQGAKAARADDAMAESMRKRMKEALRELMGKFDAYRTDWVLCHGDADGFDEWFRAEVLTIKAR